MKTQRISPAQKQELNNQINDILEVINQVRDELPTAVKDVEDLILKIEKEALIFSAALNNHTNFDLRSFTSAFSVLEPQTERVLHSFNHTNELIGKIWNNVGWELGRYKRSK